MPTRSFILLLYAIESNQLSATMVDVTDNARSFSLACFSTYFSSIL